MPVSPRFLALAFLSALPVPLTVVVAPPASAAVVHIVVNDNGDVAGPAAEQNCATGAPGCTLRAALKVAAAVAVDDVSIGIDLADGATIELGTRIDIPARTSVDGCSFDDTVTEPCVTLSGGDAIVGAPVRLTGVNGGLANVAVVASGDAPTGVVMDGDDTRLSRVWVGMDVAGVPSASLDIGVLVHGDGALIGDSAWYRTTIVNATRSAIEIAGAKNVAVNATNLGLNAAGLPQDQDGHDVAGGEVGIRIVKDGADVPDGINIGNSVTTAQHATTVCDGVCNAIGQMTEAGIKVETSAAGALVYVNGNYLGLAADGTTPAAKPGANGIDAGAAFVHTGTNGPTSRNVIAGGAYGVRQLGTAGSVDIENALIGTDATGAAALPPSVAGIYAEGLSAGVSDSRVVVAADATGAELAGGSRVFGNVFGLLADGTGAPLTTAVRVNGNSGEIGSAASDKGNVICSASVAGIMIAGGDNNAVRGNRIGVDEAGAPCTGARANRTGVVIKQVDGDVAQGNRVGDIVEGGNTISNSLHNAITIASTGPNDAVFNLGAGNGGLMVDVGGFTAGSPDDGDGLGNPSAENGHIPPPEITTATAGLVSGGGGSAGDYIYLFATDGAAGTSPHGLTAYLGRDQVSADGQGWTFVPSAPLAPGTRITAISQSSQPNTVSEFSAVASVSAPPGGPGTSAGLTVAGGPVLKGKAKVGKKVRVVIPASAPAGVVVSVQWLVGKRAVAGATQPALKLRSGYLGKKVSARVTWTLPGHAPVVLTTARVRVKR